MRKYFWQLLGTLVALAAIFATYDVFFRSKPIKRLQVIVNSPLSLVDVKPEAAGDIEVLYKGKPVSHISLLQIQIKNSGNQPIVESDYSRKISFSFAPQDELLDVTVSASDPPNLQMTVTKTSQNQAEASPILLNPEDIVTTQFLIKGNSDESVLKEFHVDGRIVGVKNIELVTPEQRESQPLWVSVLFSLLGGVVGLLVNIINDYFIRRRKREDAT